MANRYIKKICEQVQMVRKSATTNTHSFTAKAMGKYMAIKCHNLP